MKLDQYRRKIKREFVAGLSKLYIGHVTSEYFGLKLKVPLIHSIRNGGYILPAEPWMSDCIRSFIETKPGCIIDVGVNVGLYLVKLRALSKTVSYYGVDPNPACTFYTQELIRLNNFINAKLFTFAIGEEPGIKKIYASKLADGGGSLIKEHQMHNAKDYSFDTMVLNGDLFIDMLQLEENISVIKVDVEEAEIYVLRGLNNTIKKYRPFIYCEILHAKTHEQECRVTEISKIMEDHGYAIIGITRTNRELEIIKEPSKVGEEYIQEYILSPNENTESLMTSLSNNNSGVIVK